jgi:trypsin-like peptidase
MKTAYLRKIGVSLILSAAQLLTTHICGAQDVRGNVVGRIFRIAYGNKSGSSFAIEVDGRQYLITAKHVVQGIKDGDSISLLNKDKAWQPLSAKVIYPERTDVDIAALALPEVITRAETVNPTLNGVLLGQHCYFLGFPFGLASFQGGWAPIPFVKQALISAIQFPLIYLDGMNNPGFSGGPIFFIDQNTRELKFGGVISAYRYSYAEVLRKRSNETRPLDQIPTDEMEGVGQFVAENQGIVIATQIDPIIEAIKKRPIGPVVQGLATPPNTVR